MIREMEQLGRWWANSLINASVQIAVLVILVAIASFLLRNSSPVVRYALWCIVLLRLCIPVGFTLPSIERSANAARSTAAVSAPRMHPVERHAPRSDAARAARA